MQLMIEISKGLNGLSPPIMNGLCYVEKYAIDHNIPHTLIVRCKRSYIADLKL